MRQSHVAGEKLFVNYAGTTLEVIDGTTGEVLNVQLFVAAPGASSYTWAEATWTQGLGDTHPSHPCGHAWDASGRDRASGGLHRPCEHLVPRRCDLAAAKARQAGNASSNARGCGRLDNAVEGSQVDPIVNGRRQGQQPAHGCPDMVSSYTQAASGLRG
jgi:hypothetical protein